MRMYKYYIIKYKKTKQNLILFESNLGRNYSGNPRAIYEEMLRRDLDKKYKIYWIYDKNTEFEVPGNVKKIVRESYQYLLLTWQAKMWITDTRMMGYIIKNPNTKFIMTWHGTPLKKLGLDMDDIFMANNRGIERYKASFWNHSRRWDYLVAPNEYSAKIFRNCFDFKKTMLKTGYPRNDDLVNCNNQAYIDSLKDKYHIPKNKKVILYAPTFRDDENTAKNKYVFNPHVNFDILYRALKKDYVFIVKYHYFITSKVDWLRFKGFIVDIDTDIKDLYLMADIMMTDYSSTMFDYSILKRPMIFYTYDLEKYANNRGFYFDFIETAPGPFLYTTEDLVDFLKGGKPDFTPFKEKLNAFHKKFTSLETGRASAVIADLVEEIINEFIPEEKTEVKTEEEKEAAKEALEEDKIMANGEEESDGEDDSSDNHSEEEV